MRILLTTTSYQDTPGKHHDLLQASGFDVVRARGPLQEADMLKLINDGEGFDGLLNGDDAVTARVIDAALPRLRVIAKYGISLDSIDVVHATARSPRGWLSVRTRTPRFAWSCNGPLRSACSRPPRRSPWPAGPDRADPRPTAGTSPARPSG